MSVQKRVLFTALFLFTWTLLVLYPNPGKLVVSIDRLINPPIDYHLEELKPLLQKAYGKAPSAIEEMVKKEVPYEYDWITAGLPWYFPSLAEVLEKKSGDCKSQLLVLGSIFEFHRIPYTISISPTHLWISYEGRAETNIENLEVTLASFDGETFELKTPKVDWERSLRTTRNAFWDPMPLAKKRYLCGGISASLLFIIFMPAKIEKKTLPPI